MKKIIKSGIGLLVVLGCLTGSMTSTYAQPSDWAMDSVYWSRVENIAPEDLLTSNMNTVVMTREDLAELLVHVYAKANGVGIDALPTGEPFEDTENPLVGKAYQAKLMAGTTDIRFSPATPVSRLTVIKGVQNLFSATKVVTLTGNASVYTDYAQIPVAQRSTVNYLYSLGLLSGFSTTDLQPNEPATVEMAVTLLFNVAKTHNWVTTPTNETALQREDKNGFNVPIRTATNLIIYQPNDLYGIRIYYTGLSATNTQSNVDKAHRQATTIAERYSAYSFEATTALSNTLEDAWDGVRKQYDIKAPVYINGSTGAVSSVPIFTSNYMYVYSGNRLMVDFIK